MKKVKFHKQGMKHWQQLTSKSWWSCRKPAHSTFSGCSDGPEVHWMNICWDPLHSFHLTHTKLWWTPLFEDEMMMDRITINSVFLNSTKEFRISVLNCNRELFLVPDTEGTRLFTKVYCFGSLDLPPPKCHVYFPYPEVEKQHSLTLPSWYL